MSTIKVNKIENTSTTDGGVSIDVDGHVTIDGQQLPTTGPLSNRNLVYNGEMLVAQRGTSNTSQTGNNKWVVDGFKVNIDGSAVVTHSQESSGAPEGFSKWLKVTPSTADTVLQSAAYGTVSNNIEGLDFAHVNYGSANAQTLVVSFKFKTNKAGTYCMIHRNGLANRNYLHEFTPVADGNWQTITYTVPGDTTGTWQTNNTKGWRWELCIGNGTSYQSSTTESWFSGTYYHSTPNQVNFLDSTSNELGITGVQVELGTKSTPFEHVSYSQTLAKCERYCQVYSFPNQYEHICQGIISGALNELQLEFPLRNGMRAFPSLELSAVSHFRLNDYRGHDQDANQLAGIFRGSLSTVKITFKKATANMDVGRAGYLNVSTSAGGNCKMTFSSEL